MIDETESIIECYSLLVDIFPELESQLDEYIASQLEITVDYYQMEFKY